MFVASEPTEPEQKLLQVAASADLLPLAELRAGGRQRREKDGHKSNNGAEFNLARRMKVWWMMENWKTPLTSDDPINTVNMTHVHCPLKKKR